MYTVYWLYAEGEIKFQGCLLSLRQLKAFKLSQYVTLLGHPVYNHIWHISFPQIYTSRSIHFSTSRGIVKSILCLTLALCLMYFNCKISMIFI